jgi:malate synthase
MTERTPAHRLQVATELHQFIETQVLPGTGVDSATFWKGFDALVADLAPKNIALLAERDRLQAELDAWHKANPGPIAGARGMKAYRKFLEKIGYLVPVPEKVKATTKNVDAELALQAGPQLVVPITNARYALNAANARWGSLYDALYGTDAISEADGCEKGPGYNDKRGAKVIEYARHVLDRCVPLKKGSHLDSTAYAVVDNQLAVTLKNGQTVGLKNPAQFVGFQGEMGAPSSVLLSHHGLHMDIIINKSHPIGATDPAGVADLVLESALSTILDLEDSVAVVDAADKVLAYSNWLGILKGTLTEDVAKGGKTFKRGLNPDRLYTGPRGEDVALHGRSLLFVRNVGHLMTNPAILWTDAQGTVREIPEGILDAVVTTTIALHDLQGHGINGIRNTRRGSVYIVKPKMHGPAEVAFACELFSPRGAGAGPARQHRQARHHGRGAPHQRQPEGLHRRRQEPRGLHQHRLPGPHRRRDAHRHARRPHDAQGRHEVQRLDPGLREEQRAGRPGMRPARQGADRQGHVGHARPDGRHAEAQDRPPQGRRQHRLGAQPHRRHAARAALPPGGRVQGAEGAGEDRRGRRARRHPDRPADHPRGQDAEVDG